MDLNQQIWQTTIQAARANTEASSRAFVSNYNEDLTRIYLASVFNPWADSVRAGNATNENPPKPPMAYELAPPDLNGFVFYQVGFKPVCSIPAVPPNAATVVIQHSKVDKVNVPPGDTRKAGDVATGAQLIALGAEPGEIGDPMSLWGKAEHGGFMGVYRWYERIG